jgi:hypothetical protein
VPRAIFATGETGLKWENIVGVGKTNTIDWAEWEGIKGLLELDLFDHSQTNVETIIGDVKKNIHNADDFLGRLEFLAATCTFDPKQLSTSLNLMFVEGEGARAIINADPSFKLFCDLLNTDDKTKTNGIAILLKLVVHGKLPAC